MRWLDNIYNKTTSAKGQLILYFECEDNGAISHVVVNLLEWPGMPENTVYNQTPWSVALLQENGQMYAKDTIMAI